MSILGGGARIFGSKYQILKKISKSKKNFFLSEKKKKFFFQKVSFLYGVSSFGGKKIFRPSISTPASPLKKKLLTFLKFLGLLDFCNFAFFSQGKILIKGGQ